MKTKHDEGRPMKISGDSSHLSIGKFSRSYCAAWLAGLLVVGLAATSQAQFTADFQTNTIDGVGSNWAGNYMVGSNTVFDVLQVINGGGLTNNGSGYIGFTATASNNLAVVGGSGSVWNNTNALVVGNGSTGNQLVVTNGGRVVAGGGSQFNGPSSRALISGSGSLWTNSGGAVATLNLKNSFGQMTVDAGARVAVSGVTAIGESSGHNSNTVVVSDSGSLFKSTSTFNVGRGGAFNLLVVTNGGRVEANGITCIGQFNTSINNELLISGSGSVWSNSSSSLVFGVGYGSSSNQLIINDGGRLDAVGGVIIGGNGGNGNGNFNGNSVLVTGAGSLISLGAPRTQIGGRGSFNSLTVSNGASVQGTITSDIEVGGSGATGAVNNTFILTGAGSSVGIGAGGGDAMRTLSVGRSVGASNSQARVLNGGSLRIADVYVGIGAGSSNSLLLVSGPGSTVSNWSGHVNVGFGANSFGSSLVVSNGGLLYAPGSLIVGGGAGSSNSAVRIVDGGVLEMAQNNLSNVTAGVNSSIINNGGTFRFTSSAPTIFANSANGGSIAVTNGTIAFRGVASAPILGGSQLTNITFQGNNTYMLDVASNAAGLASYTFDSVANTGTATNYQSLRLTGAGSLWQSAALTIGSGGSLVVTNATATVAAAVASTGDIRVINSRVTYQSNVVVSGLYFSDPSTNTFNTNFTVTSSGYLQGGAGDLFVFERSFINQSTQSNLYDTLNASVLFTNGGTFQHVFENTGLELGATFQGYTNNFAIGTLTLASGDLLRITGGVSNALYVGVFDLGGGLSNTNNLVLDINVYYDPSLAGNAYLGGGTYDLTGTGMLIAIPEPSALAVLGLGIGVLALMARRRKLG